jgi:insulysin
LTYYLHFGSIVNQKLRIVSALLTQILSEPAHSVLRTREQLGYIVSCSSWLLPGASERGLRIVVQSEKKPGYLEERVEAFLGEMKTELEEMADEEFESHKTGLVKKWLEADKNLNEEASRLLNQITSGHLDFLRRKCSIFCITFRYLILLLGEKDAFFLKTITKDDVLSLFMTHVHPASKTRTKLSMHMVSQKIHTKKVSLAASQAFETLVHEAFPDVDEKSWKNSIESDALSLVEFGHYWLKVLNSDDGRKLLAQLPVLVDKYPVDGEGEDRRRSDVTYIEDPKAFKAGLTVSVDPGPFVQWNDLPASRL